MKPGKVVQYLDASGVSHAAVITAVVGTGASGYKRLDVAYEGGTAADVAHAGDAASGEGCWQLEPVDPVTELAASASAPSSEPARELSPDVHHEDE